MPSPNELEKAAILLFKPLNRPGAATLPAPGALTIQLQKIVSSATGDRVRIHPSVVTLFATAAVEMWLRAVHSFLVSASVSSSSTLWSAVSGYYASHYCMRSFAHVLGVFNLHRNKRIIKLDMAGGLHWCQIVKKGASGREHQFYWKTLKQSPHFANDPFFTVNLESEDISDASHRAVANYLDHLNRFENFRPPDAVSLKQRIDYLSDVELSSVPIPNRQHYPDLLAVQLVAYHRIIKFRKLLDDALGGSNTFWRVHRTPNWCTDFLDFQVVEPRFVSVYSGS